MKIRIMENINKMGKTFAFVTLPAEMADRLLKVKRTGDGWNSWRIREVLNPRRCFLCRQVGHEAKACKATDRGEVCHNCGTFGHLRKECGNETACYLCSITEHRAESMSCPVFRGMLQDMRRKGETNPANARN